jgi:hypothetical protein
MLVAMADAWLRLAEQIEGRDVTAEDEAAKGTNDEADES